MKTAKEIVEESGLTEHDQCEGYVLKVQDIVEYMEEYAEQFKPKEKSNQYGVIEKTGIHPCIKCKYEFYSENDACETCSIDINDDEHYKK